MKSRGVLRSTCTSYRPRSAKTGKLRTVAALPGTVTFEARTAWYDALRVSHSPSMSATGLVGVASVGSARTKSRR